MSQWLKQSTAVTVKVGPFVDATDGVTAETGLTISQADIRLAKNGGAFAQTNNNAGATHDENGYYGVPLDATDTGTLGTLRVAVSESGAVPVWQDFMVVPANVWDSMFGADALQVHAVEITNGLITAAAIANGAIDAATFAADVDAEILSYIVDDATRIDASALNTAAVTTIPAIETDTQDIQGRLPAALTAGGNMKSDALAVDGSTAAAARLERSAESITLGTCDAGSTTTSVVASSLAPASAVNDQWNGKIMHFDLNTTTTALRGQSTEISDYVHATLTFTVVALTTAPVSGDTFTIS